MRASPRRAAFQRERDLGRGGRRDGLVRQIRARRQKSEERDRGGTEHGGTLRETDGSLPETRPEREIVADSSPVPVRALLIAESACSLGDIRNGVEHYASDRLADNGPKLVTASDPTRTNSRSQVGLYCLDQLSALAAILRRRHAP